MKMMILSAAVMAGIAATPALAAGDAVMGQKQFGQCMACHMTEAGKPDTLGPNLAGVVGRKSGARPKFAYSPALKSANLTWDEATLDKWLKEPATLVPGTKMEFLGVSRKPTRDNIIAYLATLKK